NPVFTKRYDDTFIRCTTMVDAVPWTTYPLYIAIAVNGRPRAIQGLSTAVAHNEITFAFSYDIGPNAGGVYSLPAGQHKITIMVWGAAGSGAEVRTQVSNLQCWEVWEGPLQP